jgi:hypothetical protein
MRARETLYQRQLRRPIDAEAREAIHSAYLRRRHEIPVATELLWHKDKPQFSIRSSWVSFNVGYTPERLVVEAELSLAARMMATEAHRRQAVAVIDSIADELGL